MSIIKNYPCENTLKDVCTGVGGVAGGAAWVAALVLFHSKMLPALGWLLLCEGPAVVLGGTIGAPLAGAGLGKVAGIVGEACLETFCSYSLVAERHGLFNAQETLRSAADTVPPQIPTMS